MISIWFTLVWMLVDVNSCVNFVRWWSADRKAFFLSFPLSLLFTFWFANWHFEFFFSTNSTNFSFIETLHFCTIQSRNLFTPFLVQRERRREAKKKKTNENSIRNLKQICSLIRSLTEFHAYFDRKCTNTMCTIIQTVCNERNFRFFANVLTMLVAWLLYKYIVWRLSRQSYMSSFRCGFWLYIYVYT